MISKTQYFHAGKVQARCQAWCRTCMHEICREPQRTSNFLWIWKCSENAWIISEDPQQRLPWDVLGRLWAFWTFWDVLHVEQVLMVLHWCSTGAPRSCQSWCLQWTVSCPRTSSNPVVSTSHHALRPQCVGMRTITHISQPCVE